MKVVVVGAGIVGIATALWLRRAGVEVVVVDRVGPAGGASRGNAGVLAACSVVPLTTPGLFAAAPRMLVDPDGPLFLRWRYLPRLVPWLTRLLPHATTAAATRTAAALATLTTDSLDEHLALAAGTPAARYIVPSDYVFAYRNRAGFEHDRFAWDIRARHGFRPEILEGAAARRYEPALSPSVGLLARLPDHGHITDPAGYVRALAGQVGREGGRFVTGRAEAVIGEGGRARGVRVDGETIACDAAVLAGGAWSRALVRPLGLDLPLESERGYHMELWEPSLVPRAPIMMADGKFVVAPMEGRLRLAGVVEFGGLAAGPQRAPLALLARAARTVLPGLSWREATQWMGHRPTLADSLPVIGEVPALRGAFVAIGHHHIGLTAGPRTGRLLSGLVAGAGANIDMAPFAPARWRRGRRSVRPREMQR